MAPRFTTPDRHDYTPRQQAMYDRFTTGPRADPSAPFRLFDADGTLIGPPSIWVLSPEVGFALSGIGHQMRWGIGFSERTREAVILAVGHTLDSPFELFAHVPAARAVGIGDAELEAIAAGAVPEGADAEMRVGLEVAWEVLATGTLDDDAYARAAEVFGIEGLFQLVALITYYRMVATQLAVFGVLPPA